jgi:putative tryptophan/tyrosine transport system substrate-binding protein
MRRRDFIAGLGGAAAWPLAARAQQPALPVVGFLLSGRRDSVAPTSSLLVAFRQGLASAGFAEGRNVAFEYKFAEGQLDRFPMLADELVRERVAVIAALSGADAARAAKNATTSIPIVFLIGNDPVGIGLVASLNQPGGNLTGMTVSTREVQGKRLAVARELLPNASIIATLANPVSVVADVNLRDLEQAAASLRQQLLVLRASSDRELEEAFDSMAKKGAGALFVNASPFFASRLDLILALAARHRIPTVFASREAVAAGGLMS